MGTDNAGWTAYFPLTTLGKTCVRFGSASQTNYLEPAICFPSQVYSTCFQFSARLRLLTYVDKNKGVVCVGLSHM